MDLGPVTLPASLVSFPLASIPVAAPLDPTTSGWVGQVVALLGMLAALVVLLRWWFANRRR